MALVKCDLCKVKQSFAFCYIFKCIKCEHHKFEYEGEIYRSGHDGGKHYSKECEKDEI